VDKLWTNQTCRARQCVVRASDACSARASTWMSDRRSTSP